MSRKRKDPHVLDMVQWVKHESLPGRVFRTEVIARKAMIQRAVRVEKAKQLAESRLRKKPEKPKGPKKQPRRKGKPEPPRLSVAERFAKREAARLGSWGTPRLKGFYFADLADRIGWDNAMMAVQAFRWVIEGRVMSAEEVWCALTFHYHKVGTTKATGIARPRARRSRMARPESPAPSKRAQTKATGCRTSIRGAEKLLRIQRERETTRKVHRVARKKQTPRSA
jgi:hypothetical protein